MLIRNETPADEAAIRAVNLAAFDTPAEADLVERLRGHTFPYLSLVAAKKGLIVGHVMFTPVRLPGHPRARILGLAPMAVLPDYQHAIDCEYVKSGEVPEAAFMILELVPGHLDGLAGTVQYHAAFAEP